MFDKIQLKGGALTTDPVLDRVYQLDWRSLDYAVGDRIDKVKMYRPRSFTWEIEDWLDQGTEGACVGFSFAHELMARPVRVDGIDAQYARGVYLDAQMRDPWPGGAYPGASPFYEGTSVLAGAQVLQERGFFNSYYWGITVEEIMRGLAYFGPCVLGVNWYSGMFDTDPEGFIHPVGYVAGGHAIMAHAIKIHYKSAVPWRHRTWNDVDWGQSYVTLHNSWGPEWGINGRARLSIQSLATLLAQAGEACFPLRNPNLLEAL